MNNINDDFIKEFKLLLDRYEIKLVKNEDGVFLFNKNDVPILFAEM